MDLLQDNVKRLYFKFLTAAFGSALISSIYGVVAMAVVGQYHGPRGSAAMGVIEPVWNLIYSLGLLTGIGGSVLFSVEKEKRQDDPDAANACFTVAAAATGAIALAIWALFRCFETPMLRLFGADDALLPLCRAYLSAVKWTVPVCLLTQLFLILLLYSDL